MEIRNVADYLGYDVISNHSIRHREFIYFIIHNSLLDSSIGTPLKSVIDMVNRAILTGACILNVAGTENFAISRISSVSGSSIIFIGKIHSAKIKIY